MEDGKTIVDPPAGTGVEEAATDPAAATGTGVDPETMAAERDRALAECTELRDMMLRGRAELENFRRRSEREKADMREWAGMDTMQALLPVVDDFERALRAAAGQSGGEGAAAEFARGMELIYRGLLDALTRLGLEAVPAQGLRFDPNLHNAVQREERSDVEDQTIVEEYQRGYNYRGRLLRPAMVKVAVHP